MAVYWYNCIANISQQQLLEPPYPKHWLDRYYNFYEPAQDVRDAYSKWQKDIRQHQAALDAQATRKQRIETLELQLEELEDTVQQRLQRN